MDVFSVPCPWHTVYSCREECPHQILAFLHLFAVDFLMRTGLTDGRAGGRTGKTRNAAYLIITSSLHVDVTWRHLPTVYLTNR